MGLQPIVAGLYINEPLLINRGSRNYVGAKISQKKFHAVQNLTENYPESSIVDFDWFCEDLKTLRFPVNGQRVKDVLYFKKPTGYNFGYVSYEIVWKCNYRCPFCYLDDKNKRSVPTDQKFKIIDLATQSGAIFMQITGGEAFASKDFSEVYEYAYSKGMIIRISTNASLITVRKEVADVIDRLPPYRITISLYGASEESYERTTATKGTFKQFIKALHWLKDHGLRTRLNIVVTRENQHEIDDMKRLADSFGFECFVYDELAPTLQNNLVQINIGPTKDYYSEHPRERKRFEGCDTGLTFFHVDPLGIASPCKISREPSVNLLEVGEEAFKIMPRFNEEILSPASSSCGTCTTNGCGMCPPKIRLYPGNSLPCTTIYKKEENYCNRTV